MLKTNKIVSLILAVVLVFSMFTVAASALSDGEIHVVAGAAGLCGGAGWDPSDTNNQMTWNADKGIYEKIYENVAAGTYEFKVTTNYGWDNGDWNLTGDAMYGGPNAVADVTVDGSTVIIGFDGTKALLDIVAPSVPTEEPQPTKNTITVDGVDYEVSVGDKLTYYYYLNVTDVTQDTFKPGRIVNIEGSTYFDDSIINVTNYVENEDTGLYDSMFPVLYSMGLVCNKLDDEITYNASNLNGLRFDKDDRCVIKMEFEVVAEGSTEITTIIKNSQKFGPTAPEDDLVIIIEDGVFKGDAWKTIEVLDGVKPPVTEAPAPTETEAPTPTETEAPVPTETEAPAPATYTVAGAIAPGHTDGGILGTAWDPTNTANDLTFDEATGLWSVTYTNVPATGETDDYDDTWYEYKVVENHAWDRSFNEEGEIFGPGTNAQFRVNVDGSTVTIFFDGSKCWAEGEGVVSGPTEAPTETEAPAPTETEAPAPTETEAPQPAKGAFIRIDDGSTYPVIKGEKYRYTFYMTVNDKIGSFDASTWYDVDGLKVCPIVDEYGDDDVATMFPGFNGNMVYNLLGEAANGEILYNHSSVTGVRFAGEKAIFTIDFEVTADEGIYDIWSTVRTVANTNMEKYWQYGQELMEGTSFRSDLNGKWRPNETEAPAPTETEAPTPTETEAPAPTETEAPAPTETEAPTPTETEAPTPTEAPAKVYIRVDKDDNRVYAVETGKTYTYEYYLACDKKISSLDCTTWYDAEGLDFVPAVDEYGDYTGAEMPNLPAPVYNYDIDGEILYNFSNVAGVRFPVPADLQPTEKNIVFRGQFTVTAEEGILDIWTDLKVLGDTDNNKIVFNSELVDETVNVYDEERIADAIIPPVPTETEAPVPTETEAPTPTEAPVPTETEAPTPTEAPVPTETEAPTPTEVQPTEPAEDETVPAPASPDSSSTGGQKNPTNTNGVKTGSTTTAIAFLTVLVMAAGVVMFARKRNYN